MKALRDFIVRSFVSGVLVVLPMYLAVLLILKGVKSLARLVRPIAIVHPAGWPPAAGDAVALVLIVLICVAVGVAVRSRPGRAARDGIEQSFLVKVPTYLLVRDLTRQLTGQGRENAWKPALAEMGGGLVLAFIIEELGDGRYTVFVPSVPSPVRGSVYVLPRKNVHPVNVSFAQSFQALSRWGSGVRHLVADLDAQHAAAAADSRRAR